MNKNRIINRFYSMLIVIVILFGFTGNVSVSFAASNPAIGFYNVPSAQIYNLIGHSGLIGRSERSTYIINSANDFEVGTVINVVNHAGNGNQASIANYGTYANSGNYNYVTCMYKYTGADFTASMGETYQDNSKEWVTSKTYGDGKWHMLVFDFSDYHKKHLNAYVKSYELEYGRNGDAINAQFANWCLYKENPIISFAQIIVEEPVIGNAPADAVRLYDEINYTVKKIEWTDSQGNSVTKFETGIRYTVKATLKANDGYFFKYDGNYNIGESTDSSEVSLEMMGNELILKKQFDALPVAPNSPVGFFNQPSGQFYNLIGHNSLCGSSDFGTSIISVNNVDNLGPVVTTEGIANSARIQSYGTRAITEAYNYVTVMYKYLGQDSVLWMGEAYNDGGIDWSVPEQNIYGDGKWHTLVFDFTKAHETHFEARTTGFEMDYGSGNTSLTMQFANWCLYKENPIINSVSVEVPEPIAGDIVFNTFQLPQNASYYVENVKWVDSHGAVADKYLLGESYTVIIRLKAYKGYFFEGEGIYTIGENTVVSKPSVEMMGNEIILKKTFEEIMPEVRINLIENSDMEYPSSAFGPSHTNAMGIRTMYERDLTGNTYFTLDASQNKETWANPSMMVKCELKKGRTYFYTLKTKIEKETLCRANTDSVGMYFSFGNSDHTTFMTGNEFVKQTGIYTAKNNISSIWMIPKFSDKNIELTAVYSIDDFEIYNITGTKKITYSTKHCDVKQITADSDIVVDDMSRTIYADEGTTITFSVNNAGADGKAFVYSNGVKNIGNNNFTYTVGGNDGDVIIKYVDDVTYSINGDDLIVSAVDSGNRRVVAATYNADGSLCNVWSDDATTSKKGEDVLFRPTVNLDKAKIFCWNDLNSMKPLKKDYKVMPKTNVFIVGDNSCVENVAHKNIQGWGYYFKNMLSNVNVINESSQNATITEFLASDRYKDMKSKWKNGDYMFISFGINDCIALTKDVFSDNLKKLVYEAETVGVNAILIKEQETIGRRNSLFTHFLDEVDSVGIASDVPVIDLYSVTSDMSFAERAGDCVSLTDAGAEYVAEKLYALLLECDTDMRYYLDSAGENGALYDIYNKANNEWIPIPLRTEATGGGEGGQVCLGVVGDSSGETLLSFVDVTSLLRSTDGGKSWEHAGRGLSGGTVTGAIDPLNSNRIVVINTAGHYFASPGMSGPYLSVDKAYSFTQCANVRFTLDEFVTYADSIAYDSNSYSSEIDGCSVVYWSSPDWDKSTSQHASGNSQSNAILKSYGYNQGKGLYKSVDGGKTWQNINPDFYGCRIKVHPANSDIIYAVNETGFYVSNDGGITFTIKYEINATGLDVVQRTDSVYDNYVWFCDDEGNVYQSSSSGEDITSIMENSALKNGSNTTPWMIANVYPDYASDLRISPANPSKKMIAVSNKEIIYKNGVRYADGNEWKTINAPIYGGNSPSISGSSYFHYYYGGRKHKFYWHPSDENIVWSSGADWVLKSTDGGYSFDWNQKGNVGVCVNSRLGINVNNPDRIFVPIQDYNFAVTSDGGKTWSDYKDGNNISGYGKENHNYGGYSVDENTAFFGRTDYWGSTDVELAITRDNFENVYKTGIITHAPASDMHRYTQDPKNSNVWFADNYISTDAGYHWTEMDTCKLVLTYDYVTKDLYGLDSTYKKVLKSADSGLTWTLVHDFSNKENLETISDIAYDGINDILYVCQSAKTTDSYCKWGSDVFFLSGHRVYRSGALWKIQDDVEIEITENVSEVAYKGGDPYIVTIDCQHPNVVYVGVRPSLSIANQNQYRSSYEFSITRSVNNGDSFQVLTANNENSIVNTGAAGGRNASDFFVNPETGYLFVATNCYGLWKFAPPY